VKPDMTLLHLINKASKKSATRRQPLDYRQGQEHAQDQVERVVSSAQECLRSSTSNKTTHGHSVSPSLPHP
jgi:hypothetical protein